jgi:phosphatidylserine decarboxylase
VTFYPGLSKVAVAMVGATNVGKITLAFDDTIVSNVKLNQKEIVSKHYSDLHPIKAGDEMGVFHMGSTAIVLYPKEAGVVLDAPFRGKAVKYGQKIR